MIEVEIVDLPEGFECVARGGSVADVIYDVTPDSLGTWISVRTDGAKIYLFPKRYYRHHDLAKRLGLVS